MKDTEITLVVAKEREHKNDDFYISEEDFRKHMLGFPASKDKESEESKTFSNSCKKPFGYWLMKLGSNDTPPRGKCSKLLKKHHEYFYIGRKYETQMVDKVQYF